MDKLYQHLRNVLSRIQEGNAADYNSFSRAEQKRVDDAPGPLMLVTMRTIDCEHVLKQAFPHEPPTNSRILDCITYIGIHGEIPVPAYFTNQPAFQYSPDFQSY